MVFTTNQTPIKRSDWKKVKDILKYCKCESYILNYGSSRTVCYFRETYKRWERSYGSRKEYAILTVQDNTLFQIFGKMQYRELFLGIYEFLQSDLEEEFIEIYEGDTMPYGSIWISSQYFPYRSRLQMQHHP